MSALKLSKHVLILVNVLAIAAVSTAGQANALTITPAGTAYTANLSTGNVVFTDSFTGLTIVCNTHTIQGKTASPAAASMQFSAGASNKYSDTGTVAGKCTYSGFGTGSAAITTTATQTLTFTSLAAGSASGSITLPNSSISITLTGSLNCTMTVNASTLGVTITNSTVTLVIDFGTVLSVTGCLTTPTPHLQEHIRFSATSAISVT